MNILFLSIGGIHNIEEQGVYTDLFRQFRDNGHNVFVVCPREKKLGQPTEYINQNGVTILGVRTGNITKTNRINKGFTMLWIEPVFLNAIKKYLNNIKVDLVIYSTPPVTFEKIIRFIKKRYNARSYLLLKDIFPQNAVDLNLFNKNNPLYWYFRIKEKRLYHISDYIGCMSKANVDYLMKHNPAILPDIVEVCPNSIDPIQIDKSAERNVKIREKYSIPFDKTVFIYGGNLGKPQGIDFVIDCLESNRANDQVFFVIAGSGTEYNKLKTYFANEKPENARLFSEMPKKDYETLANSCDVGLIFLDKRFTIPNFPSRILSYMQASIPVLAATDVHSDIREVIEMGKFGFWCESDNIEKFNEKIQLLCNLELRRQMGDNARKYLENNYTAQHSYNIIMNHFISRKR